MWDRRGTGVLCRYADDLLVMCRTEREAENAVSALTVILGELVRESVVLDPYLLVVLGEERVCIGVWDGPRIIASAA